MPHNVSLAADYVLDENGDVVGEHVVIEGGRVARVGWSAPPGSLRVRGYLFPAFIDAHAHPLSLGMALSGADLRGSRSPAEVATRLSTARGPIAYGRGWDQEAFEEPGLLPDRRLLDEAVPDRPAVAVRVCGHMAVANSLALDLARPHERYPDLVDLDRGLLYEDAVYYTIERLRGLIDPSQYLEEGLNALASVGVAGVASMACSASQARALAALEASGQLPVAVACYPRPEALEEAAASLTRGSWARLAGVKLFADGSLGARTARLRSDYHDDPGNRGVLLLDWRAVARAARDAVARGLRVAVHAIGDEALDHVIRGFEDAEPGRLGRVEHASLADDGHLSAMASLGVYAVVQPRFRVSDWWIGKRLGPSRLRLAYRFASMLKAGVPLALSTDAPVEPHEPWHTLAAATGDCGRPCPSGEDIGARDAFKAYTVVAAAASGPPLEGAGQLERGSTALIAWSPGNPLEPGWRGPARLAYTPWLGPRLEGIS